MLTTNFLSQTIRLDFLIEQVFTLHCIGVRPIEE
jgi:hypothetical protein